MKMCNRGREDNMKEVIWGSSRWMLMSWILCLGLIIWIPSFGESYLMDVKQNFAIPDANITINETNAKSNCYCKNMCFIRPSCKAVTIYNDMNGLTCGFTEDEMKTEHLVPNDNAITLIPTEQGQSSCSGFYQRYPGVGCVKYVHQYFAHGVAKRECENDEANLFVAEDPQHLQRLVDNFLINVEGPDMVWMGIFNHTWFDGRSVMPEEWDEEPPEVASYRCAYLYMKTRKLRHVMCAPTPTGFVCEKKEK